MRDLSPCPFCGGEADLERIGTPRQSCIVACTDCGGRLESSEEGGACGSQWNDRHTPEGWQLVPATPTREMAESGQIASEAGCHVEGIYCDMITAAPKPGGINE